MPFGFGRAGGRGKHRRGGMGKGRGRMLTPQGRHARMPENCICPQCGRIVPHQMGTPCFQTACPNCRSSMTRQFVSPGFSDSPGQASANLIPKIEADLCTGCGKCLESCPVDAITVVNKKAIINEYRCNACRACMPACPVDAIK